MLSKSGFQVNTMKTATRDKVIVLGCSLTGYMVIRALAEKNIHLIAMTYEKRDVAQFSRYVAEVAHSPSPVDEEQFVNYLIQKAERWAGALIIETADNAAITLSKYKDILSQYYKIVTPDWDVLSLFVEKEKTYALAKQHGIPHPKSIALYGMKDIEDVSEMQYPCILKPVLSNPFTDRFQRKNFEVHNHRELEEKFKLCLDAGLSMILQEIIPGPDSNIYKMHGYINSQGKLVSKFFYRKLRQHPPQYGIARVAISIDRYPDVELLSEELLTLTNYRGYFNTEFKLDPRDGQLKLIENNCRMPRSGMLPVVCGVNYPWLIYQDIVLNQQCDITQYEVGTYWIDFWTDLYDSLFRREKEDIRLRDYFAPYIAKNKVFSDLDLKDLKPFFSVPYHSISKGIKKQSKDKVLTKELVMQILIGNYINLQ